MAYTTSLNTTMPFLYALYNIDPIPSIPSSVKNNDDLCNNNILKIEYSFHAQNNPVTMRLLIEHHYTVNLK